MNEAYDGSTEDLVKKGCTTLPSPSFACNALTFSFCHELQMLCSLMLVAVVALINLINF